MNHLNSKFDRFLTKEINDDLQEVLIYKNKSGIYDVFGKYRIVPIGKNRFKVTHKTKVLDEEFSSTRNALCFCTLLHNNKNTEAVRLCKLDLTLSSIETDIAVHKQLGRTTKNTDKHDIYITKIEEDSVKKRQLLAELNCFINTAKVLQNQNFETKTFDSLR